MKHIKNFVTQWNVHSSLCAKVCVSVVHSISLYGSVDTVMGAAQNYLFAAFLLRNARTHRVPHQYMCMGIDLSECSSTNTAFVFTKQIQLIFRFECRCFFRLCVWARVFACALDVRLFVIPFVRWFIHSFACALSEWIRFSCVYCTDLLLVCACVYYSTISAIAVAAAAAARAEWHRFSVYYYIYKDYSSFLRPLRSSCLPPYLPHSIYFPFLFSLISLIHYHSLLFATTFQHFDRISSHRNL